MATPDGIGPIQSAPAGLLGLLELKQLGENPQMMASLLQGTLELRDHYLAGTRRFITGRVDPVAEGSGAFNFAGTAQPIIVPKGKLWIVTDVSMKVLMQAAGDAFEGSAFWWNGPAGSAAEFALTEHVRLGPLSSAFDYVVIAKGIVPTYPMVPAGSRFDYLASQCTAAGASSVQLYIMLGVTEINA